MNPQSPPAFELRPLSIGEILDRTVTLYVRNFAPLTLIMLFVMIPISTARYYTTKDLGASYSAWIAELSSAASGHKSSPAKIDKILANSPAVSPAVLAVIVFDVAIVPFANVAIALAIAMVYNGQRVDVRRAFLDALRRWPAVLLMVVFEILAFLVWGVAGGLTLTILGIFGIAAGMAVPALRIIVVVLLVLAVLVWLMLIIPLLLAVLLGFCAIGIEHLSAPQAFGKGLARVYSRAQVKITVLLSLAFLAIEIGTVMVGALIQGVVVVVLKSPLLDAVLTTLFTMVSAAFLAVLVAVYYYDVRLRLEGLELSALPA